MSEEQHNGFLAAATTITAATAAPANTATAATSSAQFRPSSFIPKTVVTLNAKQVAFYDNVTNLAEFYEKHRHYTVPRSEKKLFQFCKNMKSAIRSRKELGSISSRRISEAQWKILRDIKFVEFTLELDKLVKQKPLTKSFRNLIANIESFKEQNGHTNVLDPNATLIKAVKHSDGRIERTNIIGSLVNSIKELKNGKVGKDRKKKLREKGIDLDAIMVGSGEANSNLLLSNNPSIPPMPPLPNTETAVQDRRDQNNGVSFCTTVAVENCEEEEVVDTNQFQVENVEAVVANEEDANEIENNEDEKNKEKEKELGTEMETAAEKEKETDSEKEIDSEKETEKEVVENNDVTTTEKTSASSRKKKVVAGKKRTKTSETPKKGRRKQL